MQNNACWSGFPSPITAFSDFVIDSIRKTQMTLCLHLTISSNIIFIFLPIVLLSDFRAARLTSFSTQFCSLCINCCLSLDLWLYVLFSDIFCHFWRFHLTFWFLFHDNATDRCFMIVVVSLWFLSKWFCVSNWFSAFFWSQFLSQEYVIFM